MQKSGLVYVGNDYAPALDEAQKVVGAKNHPDTVRRMLDALTRDPITKRAVRAWIADTSAVPPSPRRRAKPKKAVSHV